MTLAPRDKTYASYRKLIYEKVVLLTCILILLYFQENVDTGTLSRKQLQLDPKWDMGAVGTFNESTVNDTDAIIERI